MGTYKSVPHKKRSGNLRKTERIVVVKFRGLNEGTVFTLCASNTPNISTSSNSYFWLKHINLNDKTFWSYYPIIKVGSRSIFCDIRKVLGENWWRQATTWL